jgi:hypothetical protein
MKNTMKKLTAALLAAACLPVMGMTALAVDLPYCWGSATWGAFEGLETFNDHGIFSHYDPRGWQSKTECSEVYLNSSDELQPSVIIVRPRDNMMRFVLRDDVDVDAAARQMAEALDAYFPGMKDGLDTLRYERFKDRENDGHIIYRAKNDSAQLFNTISTGRVFDLEVRNASDITEELETDMLLTLSKQHLLSEFYGWNETADYTTGYYKGLLRSYPLTKRWYDSDADEWREERIDWDQVQAYLTEHHPGLTAEAYDTKSVCTYFDTDGNEVNKPEICYRIYGTENMTVREQVELDCEIGEQFGFCTPCAFLETGGRSTAGHNALERPCDANLDCDTDITDVITTHKQLLGVSQLDKTGVKNADLNDDGTVGPDDTLEMLKTILEITE